MEQEIMKILQNNYDNLISFYGEDQVFFVSGLRFSIPQQDLQNQPILPAFCYIPTKDDFYFLQEKSLPQYSIDLRMLCNLLNTINDNTSELFSTRYKIINPKYEKDFQELSEIMNSYFLSSNPKKNIEQLKTFIKNFFDNIINNQNDNLDIFIKELTKTEIKALNLILSLTRDNEIETNISQLVEISAISRPVFNSLFYKIKQYKIAEVDNRGVKGTRIKFNNVTELKNKIDN